MTDVFFFQNQGQKLESTNYWDSEHAKNGYFYLSWNAGAARLLVPDIHKPAIRDMKSAKYVIVSKGKWQGRDALELLFEDFSDSPYAIHLVTEQTDRLIPEGGQGSGLVVTIWTKGGLKGRLKGKYRIVDNLPCLQGWSEQ